MGFFRKFADIGKFLGKQAQAKAKKPLQQYRAIERAQKVIEEHKTNPKRAPMNLPKRKFTEEEIESSKKYLQASLEVDNKFISKLSQVKVTSDDSDISHFTSDQHSHERPKELTEKLPIKGKLPFQSDEPTEIPRGLVQTQTLVDILHNHKLDPNDWTAEVLSERFNLRTSDVAGLLKYSSLIDPQEKGKL
ncbi:NADH dehydrogenase [ubiquinone] 1 alpha subcomplex assembly factor 4-like [Ciona intestinalis]